MTYNVFSGTLNPTQSINQSINHSLFVPFSFNLCCLAMPSTPLCRCPAQ